MNKILKAIGLGLVTCVMLSCMWVTQIIGVTSTIVLDGKPVPFTEMRDGEEDLAAVLLRNCEKIEKYIQENPPQTIGETQHQWITTP